MSNAPRPERSVRHALAEAIATLGLLIVISGAARTNRSDRIAYAVGGYITAAYWFTSSTSFANPAVTIARIFSNTFAGIAPGSVPTFVLTELLGGLAGYLVIRALFPPPRPDPVPDTQKTAQGATR